MLLEGEKKKKKRGLDVTQEKRIKKTKLQKLRSTFLPLASPSSLSVFLPSPRPAHEGLERVWSGTLLLASTMSEPRKTLPPSRPPEPEKVNVRVLGDSTCCVYETAHAISKRVPTYYCDPRATRTIGTDFLVAEISRAEGGPATSPIESTKCLLWHGFSPLGRGMNVAKHYQYTMHHAFVVIFSEHLATPPLPFDLNAAYSAHYVAQACKNSPGAPILLLPSAGSETRNRPMTPAELQAAAKFAADLQQAHPESSIVFPGDVSCAAPTEDLIAAVAGVVKRGHGFARAGIELAAKRAAEEEEEEEEEEEGKAGGKAGGKKKRGAAAGREAGRCQVM